MKTRFLAVLLLCGAFALAGTIPEDSMMVDVVYVRKLAFDTARDKVLDRVIERRGGYNAPQWLQYARTDSNGVWTVYDTNGLRGVLDTKIALTNAAGQNWYRFKGDFRRERKWDFSGTGVATNLIRVVTNVPITRLDATDREQGFFRTGSK